MGDFKALANRRKGGALDDGYGEQKKWNLCIYEGCYARGTHTDVPGSSSMLCGYHYHLPKGHEALEAWKKRNEMAKEDERRARAGLPRYAKYGKDDPA